MHQLEPDATRGSAANLDSTQYQCPIADLPATPKSFLITDEGLVDLDLAAKRFPLGTAHRSSE